ATGYGRVSVPWATKSITEITCHARGINHLRDSVRTLIDIGGQDSKVIRVDGQGRVTDFVMNDKCAAGTGRFVEVIAAAAGVPLNEIGQLSLKSQHKVHISSVCTVFAESEVISLISNGVLTEDIVAGIFRAIVERAYGLVRRVGAEPEIAISGGLGMNPGIVKAWQEQTGIKLWVPDQPQMVGALGASLIAADLP
ncbi:MAG: acyl-CoA dehydratase activase, partial [Chloroflexota bacterium]